MNLNCNQHSISFSTLSLPFEFLINSNVLIFVNKSFLQFSKLGTEANDNNASDKTGREDDDLQVQ